MSPARSAPLLDIDRIVVRVVDLRLSGLAFLAASPACPEPVRLLNSPTTVDWRFVALDAGKTLSHYRLVERIGEGGMGVVWKAEDLVLGRVVALKVLPSDVERDNERRRMFLDEARLASSVSDASVAQVYELGSEGGLDFIVMEYVEGRPLNRILQGRPLPFDKIAQIGQQVARALSRTHKKGLLHRDLKPANILVTGDGDVKVVDFGLATLLDTRRSHVDPDGMTRTLDALPDDLSGGGGPEGISGAARGDSRGRGEGSSRGSRSSRGAGSGRSAGLAGTLLYMSPEQLRGEELDARSDIFSLGIVLYEMATGQRPFSGATRVEAAQEILRARPIPPHELVASVPLELDRIIEKALAANRADRYQTMEDLQVDLRRLGRDLESGSSPSFEDLRAALPSPRRPRRRPLLIAGLVAAALIVAGSGALLGRYFLRAGGSRTVLVLPMEVEGQTEGQASLGRALAEGIAVDLARARNLKILPVPEASEVPAAAGPTRAARELGADLVVSGTVIRDGRSLRASLKLVDVAQNRLVWGEQGSPSEDDLATIASTLARKAGHEIGAVFPNLYEYPLKVTGSAAMASSPELAETLNAFRHDTGTSAKTAVDRLVAKFPQELDALVLRGWIYENGGAEAGEAEEAFAAIDRADPNNPYTLLYRYLVSTTHADRPSGLDLYARLLDRSDLTPALRAWILRLRAASLRDKGDTPGAVKDLEQALRLDPASPWTLSVLSLALADAGRTDDALARAHEAISLEPNFPILYERQATIFERSRRWEEAAASRKKCCDLAPRIDVCGEYAIALHKAGRGAEAKEAATKAAAMPRTTGGALVLARYYALAGEKTEAITLLQHAVDRGLDRRRIADDPDLAALRADPSFHEIVGAPPSSPLPH